VGPACIVLDQHLDVLAAELAVVGVHGEHEAIANIDTQARATAGERGDHADLDRVVLSLSDTGHAGRQRRASQQADESLLEIHGSLSLDCCYPNAVDVTKPGASAAVRRPLLFQPSLRPRAYHLRGGLRPFRHPRSARTARTGATALDSDAMTVSSSV